MNYKHILKQEGLSIKSFAERLHLSRPTVYKMLDQYEKGIDIGEPYMDIFDAFFLEERNRMKKVYKCMNGNLLVKIVDNAAENANGTIVKNSETRGKRDIVKGEIISSSNTNLKATDKIYFPYYAAQRLLLDNQEVYIVHYNDIKFIEREGE